MAKLTAQSFTGKNEEAQRAAAQQAARLVTQVSEETRANIRNLITRSIREGIPPYDAARSIRGMVGLTSAQGQAGMNYRKGLIDSGLPITRVNALTDKYAAKQLRSRAESIARTEIMGALNAGQKAAWKDAQKEGLLGDDARKEWMTVDQACPRCAPLDGRTVGINDSFGVSDPPLHPRCMCTLGVVPGKLTARARAEVFFDDPTTAADAVKLQQELNDKIDALDRKLDKLKEGTKAYDTAMAELKALSGESQRLRGLATKLRDAEVEATLPFAAVRAELAKSNIKLSLSLDKMTPALERTVNTVAQSVIEGAKQLSAAGFDTAGVTIRFEDFSKKFASHVSAYGRYDVKSRSIIFNTKNPVWQNPEHLRAAVSQGFSNGFMSSDSIGRTFVHEFGHAQHFAKEPLAALKPRPWTVEANRATARQVSRYAALDRNEFIAETFAGLVNGRTYSAEVMSLYERLGGPAIGKAQTTLAEVSLSANAPAWMRKPTLTPAEEILTLKKATTLPHYTDGGEFLLSTHKNRLIPGSLGKGGQFFGSKRVDVTLRPGTKVYTVDRKVWDKVAGSRVATPMDLGKDIYARARMLGADVIRIDNAVHGLGTEWAVLDMRAVQPANLR